MKWITRIAWIGLVVDVGLLFPASGMRMTENAALPVVTVLWLIISLWLICTWLICYYRTLFQQWRGWGSVVSVMIVSSYITQGVIPITYPPLELFGALLAMLSVWAVGLTTGLLLWKHDEGIRLLGWSSVLLIWLVMAAWRREGNLIAIVMHALSGGEKFPQLWWLYPLFPLFGIILLAALVSFVGHTIRLISLELRRQS
jgi:hypothetical protein